MAGGSFGLCDLRLVVWKDVVQAAGMDVESIAEQRHRHRRALDVPARETGAPRARPYLHPVMAGRLPEREVTGMALARIDLAPGAGQQLVCGVARELAVRGEGGEVEVDGSADVVCVAFRNEIVDELDHLRDELRGTRVVGGRPDVQPRGILNERLRVVGGYLLGRLVLEPRRH